MSSTKQGIAREVETAGGTMRQVREANQRPAGGARGRERKETSRGCGDPAKRRVPETAGGVRRLEEGERGFAGGSEKINRKGGGRATNCGSKQRPVPAAFEIDGDAERVLRT